MSNINNEFKDRLRLAMAEKNFEIRNVSDGTKISYEMIRRYTVGLAKPRGINLDKISKFLDVDKSWLLFGTGDNKNIKKDQKSFHIEVLDVEASVRTGYLISDVMEVIKLIEYDSEQAKFLFNGIDENNLKVINITGDSMQGTFENGDIIYIDITVNQFQNDGIYVFTFENRLYVRRLQMIKNKLVVLSDNKKYRDWEISTDEFDQLDVHGKVILSQSMKFRKHG